MNDTMTAEVVESGVTGQARTVAVLLRFARTPELWSTTAEDAWTRERVYSALARAMSDLIDDSSALTTLSRVVRDDALWQDAAAAQRLFMRNLIDAHLGRKVRSAEPARPTVPTAGGSVVGGWRNLAIV